MGSAAWTLAHTGRAKMPPDPHDRTGMTRNTAHGAAVKNRRKSLID